MGWVMSFSRLIAVHGSRELFQKLITLAITLVRGT